jgi:Skp family chaperone for outer membrane proteins
MELKSLSLAVALVTVLFSASCPAEDPRVAVISMEKVFESHHETRKANEEMKERIDELEKDRKAMLDEMKTIKTEMEALRLEAEDKSLSEEAQAKRREETKKKYADYMEAEEKLIHFDRLSKNEFGSEMRATQEKIVGDIRKTVRDYVKDKKITLVLDSSGKTMNGVEPVIYFDGAMDITDAVIELLNKNKPSPEKNDERTNK